MVSLIAVSSLALAGCSAPAHVGPKSGGGSGGTGTSASSSAENHDPELGDPDLKVLGKFAVDGNRLVDSDVPKSDAAVWHRFAELFPAVEHPEVTLFVAIDADASDGIDGAMERNAQDPSQFFIAIDVTGSDEPDELDRTMIHEFAHLFSDRDGQLDPSVSEDDCPLYDNGGCPLPGSYLDAWDTDFWPDAAAASFSESDRARDTRYTKADYVTDYAATNPEEDFAETFASWVVDDTTVKPGTVVDEKYQFFDGYPALVQLRDHIDEQL